MKKVPPPSDRRNTTISPELARRGLSDNRIKAVYERWPIRWGSFRKGEETINRTFPEPPAGITTEAANQARQFAGVTTGSIATGGEYNKYKVVLEGAQQAAVASAAEEQLASIVDLAARRASNETRPVVEDHTPSPVDMVGDAPVDLAARRASGAEEHTRIPADIMAEGARLKIQNIFGPNGSQPPVTAEYPASSESGPVLKRAA
ncbi:hypothetical protein IPL85_00725 [Candidatus Saccharibacteria bacterium]|nr:MAG: hypothetical protein IPL85_00725 [Candidatus Saccharibacteria bacterium]